MPTKVNVLLMAVSFTLFFLVCILSSFIISAHISNSTAMSNSTSETLIDEPELGENDTFQANVKNCSSDFNGFCLNGGSCFHLVKENIVACRCLGNYGGERCQKYMWYNSKECNKNILPVGEFGITGVILLTLLVFFVFLTLGLLFSLWRYKLKIKKLKRKLKNPSLFFDYESYRYSEQSASSREMLTLSQEKNRFMSRSAPTTLGRISQANIDPQSNGVRGDQPVSILKPSNKISQSSGSKNSGGDVTGKSASFSDSKSDKKAEKDAVSKTPNSDA